jgi:hypothetical protein
MGTLAERANVNNLLSFTDQGRQTAAFRFPFAENKRKFAVSASVYMCVYIYLYTYIYIFIYVYIYNKYIYIYLSVYVSVSSGCLVTLLPLLVKKTGYF